MGPNSPNPVPQLCQSLQCRFVSNGSQCRMTRYESVPVYGYTRRMRTARVDRYIRVVPVVIVESVSTEGRGSPGRGDVLQQA